MKYTSQICIKVSRSASCKQARPRVIYSRHTSFLAKAGQMINKCFPSIKLCWHLIGQTRNWFIKTLPGLWMNRGDVDGLTVAESRFIPLFSISFKQMLGLSIKGGRCLLMDGIIRWLPKTICFYSNIGEVEGSLRKTLKVHRQLQGSSDSQTDVYHGNFFHVFFAPSSNVLTPSPRASL